MHAVHVFAHCTLLLLLTVLCKRSKNTDLIKEYHWRREWAHSVRYLRLNDGKEQNPVLKIMCVCLDLLFNWSFNSWATVEVLDTETRADSGSRRGDRDVKL